jgi:hypothetical protein
MMLSAGAALLAVPLSQMLPAQMAHAAEEVKTPCSCNMYNARACTNLILSAANTTDVYAAGL